MDVPQLNCPSTPVLRPLVHTVSKILFSSELQENSRNVCNSIFVPLPFQAKSEVTSGHAQSHVFVFFFLNSSSLRTRAITMASSCQALFSQHSRTCGMNVHTTHTDKGRSVRPVKTNNIPDVCFVFSGGQLWFTPLPAWRYMPGSDPVLQMLLCPWLDWASVWSR